MAPPREYRWVEERARAPKISPSAWREHEPKIRELHRTKTLKQLMEYMEETFGFTPRLVVLTITHQQQQCFEEAVDTDVSQAVASTFAN